MTELDYMLREFRKLERQLLGAKGNAPGVEESAGSKERREKLHSFILHLEDTIRQIEVGCKLEAEGKSTLPHTQQPQPALPGAPPPKPQPPAVAGTSQLPVGNKTALAKMNKEKEEEENIQKLEEHILANLLPVKVRLKKQLAVQQGASRNPAGMPVTRRGVLQPPADKGKGTFVAAVEEKRKQAEAVLAEQQRQKELAEISASGGDDSQFGKPLNTAASSLTLKLHGSTLGSGEREDEQVETTGSTTDPLAEDGDPSETPKRKVFYAGMTPGSEQHRSGVSAAAGAHKMIIETPGLLGPQKKPATQTPTGTTTAVAATTTPKTALHTTVPPTTARTGQSPTTRPGAPVPVYGAGSSKTVATAATAPTTTSALPRHPRQHVPGATTTNAVPTGPTSRVQGGTLVCGPVGTTKKSSAKRHLDPTLPEEERRRLRKLRRRRKKRRDARRREKERQRKLFLQNQQKHILKKGGKTLMRASGRKKGPRMVEYICALCSEVYTSNCDFNPWWALASHECPKCRKSQVCISPERTCKRNCGSVCSFMCGWRTFSLYTQNHSHHC